MYCQVYKYILKKNQVKKLVTSRLSFRNKNIFVFGVTSFLFLDIFTMSCQITEKKIVSVI